MKKIIALPVLVAVVCFSGVGSAKEHHGGFMETKMQPLSVEEVMTLKDDTKITMDGQIERKIGNDKYIFNDGKNSIVVEIEKKAWKNQTVTPEDRITIWGKVDKDKKETEIEVKKLKIHNTAVK